MDDDIDKPLLNCRPLSEKLPLVLSSNGVQPVIQVPASIAQYLHSYQRDGVRFLYKRYKEGEGGILADDMGLGKTIQAIAFIAALLQMRGAKEDKLRHCLQFIRNDVAPGLDLPSVNPVLVICPTSLTDNWLDELHRWCNFKVLKLSTANRFELIQKAKSKECDVLITTFECSRTNIDLLNSVNWTCVLVDEVHRIKDVNAQISKALNSLRCTLRFGLTGTPFQNNMKEIWCLLNWSSPKTIKNLGAQADKISRFLEHGNRSSATKRETTDAVTARLDFNTIRRKLMWQRTKKELGKLIPPKTDQVVFCDLTDVQKNIYRAITCSTTVQSLLSSYKDYSCIKTGSTKKSTSKRTGLLFTYLHVLQKIANHVGLLLSGLSPSSSEITQKMCRKALEEHAGLKGIPQKQWYEALSDVKMSGKMLVLSKLLPAFMSKGDKILLFSYSTKVLDLVETYLAKLRFKYWRLDGTTPAGTRCAMVKTFNEFPDPAIFLLSTKAGGFGLNITGANVVVIFDPNWNPVYDLQAQDRAHRYGQKREVSVYRLLSTSTIEEFVYLRQVYKQQLGSLTLTDQNCKRYFDSVPGDPRYFGELFGIKNLFSFRECGKSLTEELLQKQQHLEKRVRLKMEAPSREEATNAFVACCAIADHNETSAAALSRKSGLSQLCREVFKMSGEDPVNSDGDSDDWEEEEEEEEKNLMSNSISSVLERTNAVSHVVRHQEVVAPSSVEGFITDCAIRDVLQKGINSQLPASHCSLDTQDAAAEPHCVEKPCSSVPDKCRLKFNQIARDEFLTPFELATKVIAMTTQERTALLKRHQKRLNEVALETDTAWKKSRQSTEMSNRNYQKNDFFEEISREDIDRKKKDSQNTSTSVITSPELTVNNCDSRHKMHKPSPKSPGNDFSMTVVETQNSSSSLLENSSSSFEKDAAMFSPNLSKDAVLLMKGLIDNPTKEIPSKVVQSGLNKSVAAGNILCNSEVSIVSFSGPKRNTTENVIVPDSAGNSRDPVRVVGNVSSLAIDAETGLSAATVDFLDSAFFPKIAMNRTRGASTSGLCGDDHLMTSKSSASTNYNGIDFNVNSLYDPEDDIFQKLLKSGKLKRV